jgi:CRISPR-associated protein (TIGR03986 family)
MGQQRNNSGNNRYPNREHRQENGNVPEDVKVTSPYNFVPLNKEVYFPEWGPLVSHDIPFEDGLSGSLDIEIEAMSPIFIRGTQYDETDEKLMQPIRAIHPDANKDNIPVQFQHIIDCGRSKRYFIPGSSFRNMIRSVVEVLSFGKMNFVDEITDYSFRDMNNPNLYNLRGQARAIQMGWLFKQNDKKYILPVGRVGDLREAYNSNTVSQNELIQSTLVKGGRINPLKEAKTIEKKYKLKINYKGFPLANNINGSKASKVIVLTGEIGNKRQEFLFDNPNNLNLTKKIEIDSEVFENFDVAYSNTDESGKAWKFWEKNYFKNGEFVPVFFRYDDNDEILDLGLTVLYKLSYTKGIFETLDKQQKEWECKSPDLAETLFGKTKNDKLKGRVFVPHAFTANAEPEASVREFILGSPKSSFYPFYMKQKLVGQGNVDGHYQTLNDEKAEISGRKRYSIHHSFKPNLIVPEREGNQKDDNADVKSYFLPLKKGTVFKTKLFYHNLKPEELGALLSALTFHGKQDNHFHNIGLAKPYGFGKIKVKVTGEKDQQKYLTIFEEQMNRFLKANDPNADFTKTEQFTELLAMAEGSSKATAEQLKYPRLSAFAQIKKDKKGLPRFSKI